MSNSSEIRTVAASRIAAARTDAALAPYRIAHRRASPRYAHRRALAPLRASPTTRATLADARERLTSRFDSCTEHVFMPAHNLSVAPPETESAPLSPVEDPVPASVQAVIELFASQLAKVSFPDIDASTLRRQADELRSEARTVARAREQLEALVASFTARTNALGETAARAVAYARIYSDAHPERTALATALTALASPAPAASAPGLTANGKRRGRPPKRSAELFDATAADDSRDAATDDARDPSDAAEATDAE